MTRFPRWLQAGILAVFLLGGAAACGGPAGPREPDSLVIGLPYEPATLNPLFLSDSLSYTLSGMTSPGLLKFRDDLTLAPDLAEAWEISADGREIRFFLRPGVKWHDGLEFTAEDVVHTYRLITSGQIPTPHLTHFGPVQEVKALDARTVAVRYQEVYSSALESWTFGLVSRRTQPGGGPGDPGSGRAPPGTGPYRLAEWQSGRHLILEANPDYYAGRPKIRRLICRILPDAAAAFLELRAGNLDVLELTPAQYAQVLRQPELQEKFRLYRCPSVKYGLVGFNHQDPRFRDPRVRRALGLAVDREAIIQKVLYGLARPASGPYPPGTWYYPGDLPQPAPDPRRAREILTELGWYDNFRPQAGQEPRPLKLVTNYESRENLLIAEILQENWRQIGIPLRIEALEWLTFRFRVIAQRDFALVLLSRHYLFDPDLHDVWHSSKTREGEWNFLAYHNPEVDRLLELGRRTLDREGRRQIYRRIQELMAQDPPCLFLYDGEAVYLARKEIRGPKPSPLGLFHNISEWFLTER